MWNKESFAIVHGFLNIFHKCKNIYYNNMSNLIIKKNFRNPSITTNSILYSRAFTSDQINAFGWTSDVSTSTSLQNGITKF